MIFLTTVSPIIVIYATNIKNAAKYPNAGGRNFGRKSIINANIIIPVTPITISNIQSVLMPYMLWCVCFYHF